MLLWGFLVPPMLQKRQKFGWQGLSKSRDGSDLEVMTKRVVAKTQPRRACGV